MKETQFVVVKLSTIKYRKNDLYQQYVCNQREIFESIINDSVTLK